MAYVIGLDVGGTKIEGILAKATAISSLPKAVKKVRVPTEAAAGRARVLSNIAAAITTLYDYGRENIPGFKLRGIGIGTAGFLKPTSTAVASRQQPQFRPWRNAQSCLAGLATAQSGNSPICDGAPSQQRRGNSKLEMVPNIPCLKGVRLRDVLLLQLRKKGVKAPLFIENDSICFALAEFMFGAAKGCKDVIGVIVGTGIGGGLILDGRIYRGRDGGAGHIGHTTIDPSGPRCGCGQKGHFESWCSGKYITQRYAAAGGKIQNPNPEKIFRSKEAIARKIMSETYDKFGIAFANMINTFNPEVIVLGGGVSNLPEEFYRRVVAAARKYAYPALSANVKIVKNKLGDSAGVFGAAALALKN